MDLTPPYMTDELALFQETVRKFIDAEVKDHLDDWKKQGFVPPSVWRRAGEMGFLCMMSPAAYGGAELDYSYEAVLTEELARAGADAFITGVHSAIVAPYIIRYGADEQKKRWLPKMASGELIGAMAWTEPHAGSDLKAIKTTAVRDGDEYVLNGQKVFTSNGQIGNLLCVCAKTDKNAGSDGISIFFVETKDLDGFERGRNLEKIGQKAQDTSELFFDNVRIPASALLGDREGLGFKQMMTELPQERVWMGSMALGMMERALSETVAYVKERKAFGKSVMDFQNTQFKLAEVKADLTAGRVLMNHAIDQMVKGQLTSTDGAIVKYWMTERVCRIVDDCLQLHGGWGYMMEYPIAQMWTDSRIWRISGGTNEIMRLLIARDL